MNQVEATKLLALIKVAYPTSYRDLDEKTREATINMWHLTFESVPYGIMEIAFEHFRRVSKFPPTIAEMREELKSIYYKAYEDYIQCNNRSKFLGDKDNSDRKAKAKYIMDCTQQFERVEININYSNITNKQIEAYYGQHKMLGG